MVILALFGTSFLGIMILTPLITFIINKFAAKNKNIQALFSYTALIISLMITTDLFQYFEDIQEERYGTGMDATYWEIAQNAYFMFTIVIIGITLYKLGTRSHETGNIKLQNLIIISTSILISGLIFPNIIYLIIPFIIIHIISDNFNFNQYYIMIGLTIILIIINSLSPSFKLLQTREAQVQEKNITKMKQYSDKFKEPFDNYKLNIIPEKKGNFSFTLENKDYKTQTIPYETRIDHTTRETEEDSESLKSIKNNLLAYEDKNHANNILRYEINKDILKASKNNETIVALYREDISKVKYNPKGNKYNLIFITYNKNDTTKDKEKLLKNLSDNEAFKNFKDTTITMILSDHYEGYVEDPKYKNEIELFGYTLTIKNGKISRAEEI